MFILGLTFAWTAPMLQIQIDTLSAQGRIDKLGASIVSLGDKIGSAEASTKSAIGRMFKETSFKAILEPLNEIKNTLNKISASKVSIKADTSEATKSVSKLKQSLLNQNYLAKFRFTYDKNKLSQDAKRLNAVISATTLEMKLKVAYDKSEAKKAADDLKKAIAAVNLSMRLKLAYDKSEAKKAADDLKKSIAAVNLSMKLKVAYDNAQAKAETNRLKAYIKDWNTAISIDLKFNADKLKAELNKIKQIDLANHLNKQFDSKARDSIIGYVSQMEKLSSASVRQEQQLIQLRRGWNLLTEAEQKAALMAQDTARAMKIVEPLISKQVNSLERYKKQLDALGTARISNISSGGTQGISASQYAAGTKQANAQLVAHQLEALKASRATRLLSGSHGTATQATAVFRSALQASNLSIGYMTASTVIAATVTYGFVKALSMAVTQGSAFEFQFERAAVLMSQFGKIGTESFGKLTAGGEVLKAKVIELAKESKFSTTQVAEGAEVLAQAGFGPIEAFNSLGPILDLASVGMISVADSATIATDVMAGFKIGASELTSAVDSIAVASVDSKLSIKDIGVTMRYTSGIAGNLGLSLNNTLTALEAMGEFGVRASKAGTSGRTIFSDILGGDANFKKLLDKYKVQLEDFTKEGQVNLRELFKALKGATVADFRATFGQYSYQAAIALQTAANAADDASGSWYAYEQRLKNAAGAARELSLGLRQNLSSAVENLQSNIEAISTQAFDSFGAGIESEIRSLTDYLEANGTTIAQTLASVVQSVLQITSAIIKNIEVVKTFFLTFLAFKVTKSLILGVVASIDFLEARQVKYVAAQIARNKALELSARSLQITQAAAAAGSVAPLMSPRFGAIPVAGVVGASSALSAGAVAASRWGAGLALAARGAAALTGPVGFVILSLVSLIPLIASVSGGFSDAKAPIEEYSNALKVMAIVSRNGVSALDKLSDVNLRTMVSDLSSDLDKATAKVTAARAEMEAMNLDYEKTRSRRKELSGPGLGDAAFLAKRATEEENLTLALGERLLAERALTQANEALMVSQGKAFADSGKMELVNKADLEALNSLNNVLSGPQNVITPLTRLRELVKTPLESFLTPGAFDALKPASTNLGKTTEELQEIQRLLVDIGLIDADSPILANIYQMVQLIRPFLKSATSREAQLQADRDLDGAKRDAAAAALEAESAYKSALQASMSTMETYIKDFEKRTGSTAELTRQLKELSVVERQIGSGEAAAKLKEMGVSVDQAMKAVDFGRRGKVLEYLSQKLAEVDPRFSDLSKALTKTTASAYTVGQTLPIVTKELEKLAAEKGISPALMQGLLTDLPAALSAIETGAFQANKEFDALIEKSKIDWAALNGASSLEDEVKANSVGGFSGKEEFVRQTLAQIKVTSLYSEEIKGTLNETEKLAQAELLLTEAYKGQAGAAATVARVMATLRGNSPTGALEKENRNLQNQIALVGQGSEALAVYNSNWADTNGQLYDLGPAYDEAVRGNIRLREELEQMTAVQETFERFGEGVAGTFRDIFNGGIKTFGDFASKLKQEFKNLIAELVYMAIKNSIMSSLFGQGSGNTQGFFGAITQGFSQITGGRSNGGFGGGGLGGLFSSFFGGGTGQSTASAGKGLDLGSLTSNAVSSYTGASSSSGGGLGQFFSSLAGGNGLSFGQMASYFSPGFGGAAGGVPSGLFGGGGKFLKGGSAGKGPITTVGSGTSAAIAQGGLLGGITGLYQGYKAGGGGLSTAGSTLTYGLGGATLGAAGASILATGGLAGAGSAIATAGSAAGLSAGAAAALPIIGWIAAATMLIDQFTGGKVFGTKYRPESVTENIALGVAGGDATLTRRDVRQRSLFKGRQWTNVAMDVPSEMQKMANDFFKIIDKTMSMTGRELEVKVPKMIEASFSTKTEYDKKGKETGKKTSAMIAGISYEDISFEDFQKISNAEQMIAVVRQSVSEIMQQGVVDSLSTTSDEVSSIVNAWRGDVDLMLEGAALLVAAQNDIVDGSGLFGEVSGSLTLAVAAAEKYQNSNETLADTYLRVKETVKTVEDSFGFFGISLGRTREQFVDFSMELVNSLGGLDKAGEKLRMFAEAYGQIGGGDLVAGQAFKRRGTLLGAVGLDADTSGSDFGGAFTRALPSLSPEDLANWVEAGNSIAVVNSALKEMAASASANAANDLVTQVDNQIAAIARLGASEAELAQAREYGNTIIKNALDELMAGIDEGLAGFEGRTNVVSLNKIRKEMEANIVQARRLGASLSQLARIQQLAAYQIQKVLADLRFSITDLTKQLYNTDAIENATNQQLDASNSLQEAELERYKASQDAIKKIIDFLKDLDVSDLAPGGTKDRLAAAGTQFRDLLLKAQSGDPEALNGITDAAKTYLELAKEYFGSTPDYGLIFTEVTSALTSLTGLLGQIEPPTGSSGGSSSDSSSQASTQKTVEEIKAERFQLALTLSQSLGELGIGLQTDVYGLIKEFGIDIVKLASDLGIDKTSLNKGSVSNIGLMAQALGVPVKGLIDKLGITGNQIADAFGIKFGDYSTANLTALKDLGTMLGLSVFDTMSLVGIDILSIGESLGLTLESLDENSASRLVELATTLGVQSSDLMTALGISISDLAIASGLDIKDLTGEMFTKFIDFANTLGTDILSLGTALGADPKQIAEGLNGALTTGVEAIPGMPQSIKDELQPFLDAIKNADSSAAVKKAVEDLIGFTNLLPEEQKNKLLGLFKGLGLDVDTGTKDIGRILTEQYLVLRPIQQATSEAARDTVTSVDETNRLLRDELAPIFRDIRDSVTAPVQQKSLGAPVDEFMDKSKTQQEENYKQQVKNNEAQAAQNKEMAEQVKALTEALYRQSTVAAEQTEESIKNLQKISKNTKKASETPRTVSKKL